MSAMLQPRLKMPKPAPIPTYNDHKGSKGGGKNQKGSKGGGKSPTKSGPRWVPETWIKGQRKAICMRFQSNNCNLGSNCKFAHICAMPKSMEKPAAEITVQGITTRRLTDQWQINRVSHRLL